MKRALSEPAVQLGTFGKWLKQFFEIHKQKRFVIYGDPTTGKSTVCKWVKENKIIEPSLVIDSDDLIIRRWGPNRLLTFFSTATEAEFDEYHRTLRSYRLIFTNHEDYILGDSKCITWAFTRTKDTLSRELRRREEQRGRTFRSSDYPWLANWSEKKNAIVLDDGEYIAEVIEWLAGMDYPHTEYYRLLRKENLGYAINQIQKSL
jgi:hypothetical protein